jgi:hypothetical protein
MFLSCDRDRACPQSTPFSSNAFWMLSCYLVRGLPLVLLPSYRASHAMPGYLDTGILTTWPNQRSCICDCRGLTFSTIRIVWLRTLFLLVSALNSSLICFKTRLVAFLFRNLVVYIYLQITPNLSNEKHNIESLYCLVNYVHLFLYYERILISLSTEFCFQRQHFFKFEMLHRTRHPVACAWDWQETVWWRELIDFNLPFHYCSDCMITLTAVIENLVYINKLVILTEIVTKRAIHKVLKVTNAISSCLIWMSVSTPVKRMDTSYNEALILSL